MTKHTATFFLSAGRCGTQTLYHTIKKFRPDARVEHEAIGGGFRYVDQVYDFIADVKETLETQDFIMTGWPSLSAMPLINQRLGAPTKKIAIYRDYVDQYRSLQGHDLEARLDDMAMLLPGRNIQRHLHDFVTTAHKMTNVSFRFEELMADPVAAEVDRLAGMLGITETNDFANLLSQRVDDWPSQDAA